MTYLKIKLENWGQSTKNKKIATWDRHISSTTNRRTPRDKHADTRPHEKPRGQSVCQRIPRSKFIPARMNGLYSFFLQV